MENIKSGNISLQNDVAILFCDFVDFDQMINQEGTNIVRLLDEIFRNFDHYCTKYAIQKIEVFYFILFTT